MAALSRSAAAARQPATRSGAARQRRCPAPTGFFSQRHQGAKRFIELFIDGSGTPIPHRSIAFIEEKSRFQSRQLQASQKPLLAGRADFRLSADYELGVFRPLPEVLVIWPWRRCSAAASSPSWSRRGACRRSGRHLPVRLALVRFWRHSGFSLHRSRPVAPEEREDLEQMARYILRNPSHRNVDLEHVCCTSKRCQPLLMPRSRREDTG